MLAPHHRLRDSATFREVTRRGQRVGGRLIVLHRLDTAAPISPRVGFVVSRAVGNAVTRNLVKRRLRHLLRDRITGLPDGSMLVVRALPRSAEADSTALGEEIDRQLTRSARIETGS